MPSEDDTKILKDVVDALSPVIELLEMLQSETKPTLPAVFIGVKTLIDSTSRIQANSLHWSTKHDVCSAFVDSLRARFAHVIQPSYEKFDPTYLVATLLDPRLGFALEDDDTVMAQNYLCTSVRLIATYQCSPRTLAVDIKSDTTVFAA